MPLFYGKAGDFVHRLAESGVVGAGQMAEVRQLWSGGLGSLIQNTSDGVRRAVHVRRGQRIVRDEAQTASIIARRIDQNAGLAQRLDKRFAVTDLLR